MTSCTARTQGKPSALLCSLALCQPWRTCWLCHIQRQLARASRACVAADGASEPGGFPKVPRSGNRNDVVRLAGPAGLTICAALLCLVKQCRRHCQTDSTQTAAAPAVRLLHTQRAWRLPQGAPQRQPLRRGASCWPGWLAKLTLSTELSMVSAALADQRPDCTRTRQRLASFPWVLGRDTHSDIGAVAGLPVLLRAARTDMPSMPGQCLLRPQDDGWQLLQRPCTCTCFVPCSSVDLARAAAWAEAPCISWRTSAVGGCGPAGMWVSICRHDLPGAVSQQPLSELLPAQYMSDARRPTTHRYQSRLSRQQDQ